MSRENLDLALLMYEVFNRRDLDAMLALMHDEVEIESRPILATDQVARRNVHLVAQLCDGSRGPQSH